MCCCSPGCVQGLLRAPKASIPTEVCLVKLWRHECCRVFGDKLTTLEDKSAFQKELDHQTAVLGRMVVDSAEVGYDISYSIKVNW